MEIESLEMTWLEIPFKVSFKHTSAERSKTASFWVTAKTGSGKTIGCGEGCPRSYVTGEDVKSASRFFDTHRDNIIDSICDLSSLKIWIDQHSQEIDQHPAAWCAVELAILDLIGRHTNVTQEQLLDLPVLEPLFHYSAVLGNSPLALFTKQASQYLKLGFTDFKIKLSGDYNQDQEKINYLNQNQANIKIRADANNLWSDPDAVIEYLCKLDQAFWAIEEPILAKDFQGLAKIASSVAIKIILDESFIHINDLSNLPGPPETWVLNFRVSKLGGLIRSLKILEKAKLSGHTIIVGAHVGETSVLTRAGLTFAATAVDSIIAMEGAFGTHLLEYDICKTSLMFTEQGVLYSNHLALLPMGNGLSYQHNSIVESKRH